jgi:hypothetical protein
MVHDVPSSGAWIHPDAIHDVWTIYDRFWLSDATFHGYWEPDCPVTVEAPLVASAYAKNDAAVIVIGNLTPEPAEGTLRIDTAALRVGEGWTVTHQPSGDTVDAAPGLIPVRVPARDYRVIAIAP